MKRINMGRAILLGIVLLCMLTGCYSEPFTYEFRQPRSNVEKVEICAYDHREGTREVLGQLDDESIDDLLADIQALSCNKETFSYDTPREYGDVVIFITYLDGEEEMIGIINIGWRAPDGTHHLTKKYFGVSYICAVIAKYVDAEVLAEFDGF